jgi:acetyl esterase/lipase
MTAKPDGPVSVEVEDVEYAVRDGMSLLARLHQPVGQGPFPLVIEIHGGTWVTGDRHTDAALNDALARRGVAVASIDFGMPPTAGYPASMQDINSAVRCFRKNAEPFGIAPQRIGVLGTSSGAHQAIAR